MKEYTAGIKFSKCTIAVASKHMDETIQIDFNASKNLFSSTSHFRSLIKEFIEISIKKKHL